MFVEIINNKNERELIYIITFKERMKNLGWNKVTIEKEKKENKD